ncbi:cut8/STS1 family protein [Bacillus piscicola]|uniref:cut8/STS1 family protein n=1 Tax=Bacillus piscicola TaxID=1632684 RepID=UPI001F08E40D|nr:cut8/STS1 family protein [Bacillus piscicola]
MPESEKANKETDIKSLISSLSKEEMAAIILDVCERYPEVEKRIVFTYAPAEDEVKAAKKVIKECINRYKKRGFINYHDVFPALQGAEMTLEKADDKVERGETETAVLLSLTVMGSVVAMIGHSDDSSGHAGFVIDQALKAINKAIESGVKDMNESERHTLFTALMKEARLKRYDGWTNWRLALMRCCVYLCDTNERRKKLENELSKMLEAVPKQAWGRQSQIQQVKLIQLEVIEFCDGDAAAETFIHANLEHSAFREKAIERLLAKEEYKEVIKLCEQGLEIDKDYRGLGTTWKKYQLQAYEALGDIQKQRELLLEFLYGNDSTYYPKLKNLYSPEEWPQVLQEIVDTFKQMPYLPSTYEEILIEEGLTAELLESCKKTLLAIEHLYPYLVEEYPEAVNELFIKHIKEEADRSTERKQYRQVCKTIRLYQKACGTDPAQTLIEELKDTHKRRPAFLDELNKIK